MFSTHTHTHPKQQIVKVHYLYFLFFFVFVFIIIKFFICCIYFAYSEINKTKKIYTFYFFNFFFFLSGLSNKKNFSFIFNNLIKMGFCLLEKYFKSNKDNLRNVFLFLCLYNVPYKPTIFIKIKKIGWNRNAFHIRH